MSGLGEWVGFVGLGSRIDELVCKQILHKKGQCVPQRWTCDWPVQNNNKMYTVLSNKHAENVRRYGALYIYCGALNVEIITSFGQTI